MSYNDLPNEIVRQGIAPYLNYEDTNRFRRVEKRNLDIPKKSIEFI
jgi:hypothetical protein